MKVKELEGEALDRAVGFAEGCDFAPVAYSTKWEFGGPIIELEAISVVPCESMEEWAADMQFRQGVETQYGPTPLIAAMRCFVASKLGDEVERLKVDLNGS